MNWVNERHQNNSLSCSYKEEPMHTGYEQPQQLTPPQLLPNELVNKGYGQEMQWAPQRLRMEEPLYRGYGQEMQWAPRRLRMEEPQYGGYEHSSQWTPPRLRMEEQQHGGYGHSSKWAPPRKGMKEVVHRGFEPQPNRVPAMNFNPMARAYKENQMQPMNQSMYSDVSGKREQLDQSSLTQMMGNNQAELASQTPFEHIDTHHSHIICNIPDMF